jgi:uncharacterized protein (DUF924 family)
MSFSPGWPLVDCAAQLVAFTTVAVRANATRAAEAATVVDFWREAGPARWFAKDADFDGRFRERFLSQHEALTQGELARWPATAEGALAAGASAGSVSAQRPSRHAAHVRDRRNGAQGAGPAIDTGHDRTLEAELQRTAGNEGASLC